MERELFGKVLHLIFNALSLIYIKKMQFLLLCKLLPKCSHLSKYGSISIKMLQALAKRFFSPYFYDSFSITLLVSFQRDTTELSPGAMFSH